MSVLLPTTRASLTVPKRLLLFVAAVAVGFVGGLSWSVEISTWAYDGLVRLVTDPGIQIASQAMGVGLAFLVGFVHITTI